MGPDRSLAIAAVRTITRKFERTQMAASSRIGKQRIEKRHPVGHFLKRPPDVPAQAQIQRKTRPRFHIVLNVGRIILVPAASLRHPVLGYTAVVYRPQ